MAPTINYGLTSATIKIQSLGFRKLKLRKIYFLVCVEIRFPFADYELEAYLAADSYYSQFHVNVEKIEDFRHQIDVQQTSMSTGHGRVNACR